MSMLAARRVKPLLSPALAVPAELIAGKQPRLLVLAVQYVVGDGQLTSTLRTNASWKPLLSLGTRLGASLENPTRRPSADIHAPMESPLGWFPAAPRLT